MGAQQRVYRNRIKSTTALRKIFSAQELIATSRIAKARQAVAASTRLYEQRIGTVAAGGLVLGAVLGPGSVESVAVQLEADRVEGLAVGAVGTSAGGVHVDEKVDEVAEGGTLVGGADSPEALARALEVLRGLTPPKDG